MGRSINKMRTVAIDPVFTPHGAPVWVEKSGSSPIRRLMVAQDTGGAIKGPQRADIFYGTGAQAGDDAGTVKDGGRLIVLLPIDRAYAMLPEARHVQRCSLRPDEVERRRRAPPARCTWRPALTDVLEGLPKQPAIPSAAIPPWRTPPTQTRLPDLALNLADHTLRMDARTPPHGANLPRRPRRPAD
jgi:hypothetical protein